MLQEFKNSVLEQMVENIKEGRSFFEVEFDVIKDYAKKASFKVDPLRLKLQSFNDKKLEETNYVVVTKVFNIDDYVALCGNKVVEKAIETKEKVSIIFVDWTKFISMANHNFTVDPHTLWLMRTIIRMNSSFGLGVR